MPSHSPEMSRLIVYFNQAMLGEIPWALRSIRTSIEGTVIKVQFVFDGPIGDDDRDSASDIAGEVVAGFPDYTINEAYLRIDEPQKIPHPGDEWRVVYQRKEPRNKPLD